MGTTNIKIYCIKRLNARMGLKHFSRLKDISVNMHNVLSTEQAKVKKSVRLFAIALKSQGNDPPSERHDSRYTVRKMDLILRSIQWRPQMQFSMARKFTLQDYADMT